MQLVLKNIECRYRNEIIIRELSYSFQPGRIVGILGPNGSGKTTLLRTILGLVPPVCGSVQLDGRSVLDYPRRELARYLAYVPQNTGQPPDYLAEEVVKMGSYPYQGAWAKEYFDQQVARVMELTGCSMVRNRLCSTLSGGELQRVMIAKALLQQPEYLLLDEPTSNLDIASIASIGRVLTDISRRDQKGIVVVSHDVNFLSQISDTLILFSKGTILASGNPREVLTEQNLLTLFDQQFRVIQAYNSVLVCADPGCISK